MRVIPDTSGWDTVFAISVDQVNLTLQGTGISAQYTRTKNVTGGTAGLTWQFAPFRIERVDGAALTVALDFATGSTLSLPAVSDAIPLDEPQWSCHVTFAAAFEQRDDNSAALVAIKPGSGPWATVAIVEPSGYQPPAGTDAFTIKTVLRSVLADWFTTTEALRLFEQEFVRFDMGGEWANDRIPWLRPILLGFAGATMDNAQKTPALGIFAMTANPDSTTAEQRAADLAAAQARATTPILSPDTIPSNTKAAFLISDELFLRRMLMPACAGAFGGDEKNPTQTFEVYSPSSSGTTRDVKQLRNNTALEFKESVDGTNRTATIEARKLNFNFETVEAQGSVSCRLRMTTRPMTLETQFAGFTIDAEKEEAYEAKLVPNPSVPGRKIFLLDCVSHEEPQLTKNMSTGIVVAEAALTTIVAAVAAAAGVLTFKGPLATRISKTAAKYLTRILILFFGLALGAIVNTPGWILIDLVDHTQKLDDFSVLIDGVLQRISFPGAAANTKFVPTSAQFANGLLISVDPMV
jgi:hypothetical protein